MEQAVLITGKQSSFTDDLIQETLRRTGRVFASYDENDTAPEVPDTFGDSLRYIPWTRRSLISARTMMLSIEAEGEIPQGLAQSMIAFYENEPFTLRGLYASDADGRGVAQWALEQIIDRSEKSAGRWQKYGQKMSLLPFRR
jgi:hypothetical protein